MHIIVIAHLHVDLHNFLTLILFYDTHNHAYHAYTSDFRSQPHSLDPLSQVDRL